MLTPSLDVVDLDADTDEEGSHLELQTKATNTFYTIRTPVLPAISIISRICLCRRPLFLIFVFIIYGIWDDLLWVRTKFLHLTP